MIFLNNPLRRAISVDRRRPRQRHSLDDFVLSRRTDKQITSPIAKNLCRTFVTPLDREDIEALPRALDRIPKGTEKIVECVVECCRDMGNVDFHLVLKYS